MLANWRLLATFALPALIAPLVPASAHVIYGTKNIQYDNVNIAADTDAFSITGEIDHLSPSITMTFDTMIGPDRSPPAVEEHGQHGVAFVESFHDSQPSVTHTGFAALTLRAMAGTTWDAGDFTLDELNGLADGTVTFSAFDAANNPLTVTGSDTFAISENGQNHYNFSTSNGETISSLVITTNDPVLLQDIKQVSLEVTGHPVPEPSSLALLAAGLLGLSFFRRRSHRPSA